MNPESSSSRFGAKPRKVVRLSGESLVKTGYLDPESKLPLVIEPATEGVNLIDWVREQRDSVTAELDKHGGILFRNFNLGTTGEFEAFIAAVCSEPLQYTERSSPRSQVSGNIYTSTDYPPTESIFLHNEQSYNLTFPTKIGFFCMIPAQERGETPIADSRKVLARIRADVRDRFVERNYMYVRNFGAGLGLTWQEAFQTSDPAEVEAYCRNAQIELEWQDGGRRLRTRQVRRVLARHPRNGQMTWFNHLTFFHVSTLPPHIRDAMLKEFAPEDLPNNTYYGDGSPIEPEALDHLREIYRSETVSFPWQKGDVLLLDNMLVAHGRSPFSGPRKVVVGMADLVSWESC
ncbi:MAG TPA: TauD/TfdA family dioxygenase [Thermoanaerobaculia bacterium]